MISLCIILGVFWYHVRAPNDQFVYYPWCIFISCEGPKWSVCVLSLVYFYIMWGPQMISLCIILGVFLYHVRAPNDQFVYYPWCIFISCEGPKWSVYVLSLVYFYIMWGPQMISLCIILGVFLSNVRAQMISLCIILGVFLYHVRAPNDQFVYYPWCIFISCEGPKWSVYVLSLVYFYIMWGPQMISLCIILGVFLSNVRAQMISLCIILGVFLYHVRAQMISLCIILGVFLYHVRAPNDQFMYYPWCIFISCEGPKWSVYVLSLVYFYIMWGPQMISLCIILGVFLYHVRAPNDQFMYYPWCIFISCEGPNDQFVYYPWCIFI